MAATTQVKGTAIAASVRFLTERFGAPGLQKVLATFNPEERATLTAGALASAWYPIELLARIMREAHRHFGAQVPRLYEEMGAASAEYALTTVYRIFFKVGSPHFIISKASSVFEKFYSTGTMTTVVSEKGHAVLEIQDFQDPFPELCERISGWLKRTLELSGAKDIRIVHPECLNRGHHACRFEGWWS